MKANKTEGNDMERWAEGIKKEIKEKIKSKAQSNSKTRKKIKRREISNSQSNSLLMTPPMGICPPSASQWMHLFQVQLLYAFYAYTRIHLRDARHVITDTTHPGIMCSVWYKHLIDDNVRATVRCCACYRMAVHWKDKGKWSVVTNSWNDVLEDCFIRSPSGGRNNRGNWSSSKCSNIISTQVYAWKYYLHRCLWVRALM